MKLQPDTHHDGPASGWHGAFWCRTLGDLALYRDPGEKRPVAASGKPLAVLVYLKLACNGRASREHLAELFWPHSSTPTQRHSLRQALYRLRQASGGSDLVDLTENDLTLSDKVIFDFTEAEQALSEGDLEQALDLLRGNFLEGFDLSDSCEFENWVEAERRRFRALHVQAATTLTQRYLHARDGPSALQFAEEVVALNPFDDAAIRLVMQALAEQGRHATAVARFEAYRELLARELEDKVGADLSEYAAELANYLKTHRPKEAELPLVGRAEAWSALEAAWESAQRYECATTLIEGVAGIGKTRMLSELVRRVEAADGLVLASKCYEIEEAVPYAAIAEALEASLEHRDPPQIATAHLQHLARLLPDLREAAPGISKAIEFDDQETFKHNLYDAAVHYLKALASEQPVLLVVDDFHWADAPSLELLHNLSHRLEGGRVLLAGSYRPAELTPSARRFARSLCAERLATLVVLEPLSREDIASLVCQMAALDDTELGRTLVDLLHRHTAGNPLFLTELLNTLKDRQLLRIRNGRWVWTGSSDTTDLPATLGKLLSDRIDRLSPWERAFVEALAVNADETLLEILAHALDFSEPRAELALSVLQEARLVKRARAGSYELVHDELRYLVYQGIPDHRRRVLHGAIAHALEAQGVAKVAGGAARLAYHFDQAALAEKAHHYATLAAGEAESFSADEAARRHHELAASHSPKALPPRASTSSAGRRTSLSSLLSRPAVQGAVGLIAVAAVVGGTIGRRFLAPEAPIPPYQQGTLYLSPRGPWQTTHRLEWPTSPDQLARIVELDSRPADRPPDLLLQPVAMEGGTHEKLFRVEGRDTIQLTFGTEDEGHGLWSPDQRFIAFQRGWRASSELYTSNIFLVEPEMPRALRRVTDTRFQDGYLAWSPTGGELAFSRDSAGTSSVWICDADGENARNLSERFELPNARGMPAFSPDSRRLAVLYQDIADAWAVHVIDLDEGLSYSPPTPAVALYGPAVWSPDGRWIAYSSRLGEQWALRVSDVSGQSPPRLLAASDSLLRPAAWSDGVPRHVSSLNIQLPSTSLATGIGVRVGVRALTPTGAEVQARIRWSVADTVIAGVDDLGFLRGRAPGFTRVVASLGGVLADTARVEVRVAPVDTLLYEDWSSGLDSTVWTSYGIPRPFVAIGDRTGGRPAFVNNGDFNHSSGVVSNARFGIGEEGLTLELEGLMTFTGGEWQTWDIGLTRERFLSNSREFNTGPIHLGMDGGGPAQAGATWFCGTPPARGELQLDSVNDDWHVYSLQLRPDGHLECWRDHELWARVPLVRDFGGSSLAVVLNGQMEGTNLYHGRVVVTRGLRR